METNENLYIEVAYKLYTIENGETDFAEETEPNRPFHFVTGLGMVLEAFEGLVKDFKEGEKFDIVINKKDAYGEYDKSQVKEVSKDIFRIKGHFDREHVYEGAIIPLMTAEGEHFNGCVSKVLPNTVIIDLNHPLAGCDLNFIGEIKQKRPATAKEIADAATIMNAEHECGCGCDECGEGGCGNGCDHHHHQHEA